MARSFSFIAFCCLPLSALAVEKELAVEVKKDVPYTTEVKGQERKNLLDLYLPKGLKDFPTIFFVHGGSWKSGDKVLYGSLGALFAKRGYAMAVINYRLTTGSEPTKHPGHIEDVAKAFSWVYEHISEYGGSKEKLFLCGHSAGGHLVSLLAAQEKYLQAQGIPTKAIRGVLALSGVYQITEKFPLFARVFGENEQVCKEASPITHVKKGLPPFLLLYAENDLPTLGSMAENMAKELKKAEVNCQIQMLDKRDHFTIIIKPVLDPNDPGLKLMFDFLKANLP